MNRNPNTPLPFQRLHFIGIAGAGMSSLAAYLAHAGYTITGSDAAPNQAILEYLTKCGISVTKSLNIQNVKDADCVVYSSAIPITNIERIAAQNEGKLIQRGELLAMIGNAHPKSFAICGTHGKGTTAGALLHMCKTAGLKTNYILGARLQTESFASHFEPNSDVLITEVDESDRTHEYHRPYALLINNLEADHLNVYGSLESIVDSFVSLVKTCILNGSKIFIQNDGEGFERLYQALEHEEIQWLEWNQKGAGICAQNVVETPNASINFDYFANNTFKLHANPCLLGENNAHDIFAATALAFELGLKADVIEDAIHTYLGLVDRCQVTSTPSGITLVTDYASHPTCIRRDIAWLRKSSQSIVAIYQPFRYSLMAPLWLDLQKALQTADHVLIAPFDGAGEAPVPGIGSEELASAIVKAGKKARAFISFDDLKGYANSILKLGDYLVVFGGGYIFQLARDITSR